MFVTTFKPRREQTTLLHIPPSQILPCPYQPRKLLNKQALEDLTENIKENGILQPLTVTRLDNGKYQLIAGHRRLLAAGKAGLDTVPVVVLDKTREEVAVLAVIENLQREDLNFFEQAMAIQSLMTNLNLTQQQVGQKLSLSQPAIANKLKLLQFPKELQTKILAFNLSERHARAVARLPREKQSRALDYIIHNNLNVSRTDKYVNSLLVPKEKHRQNVKFNLRDVRIFTNTITKAVKMMQTAGIKADFQQKEDEYNISYYVTIPKTT